MSDSDRPADARATFEYFSNEYAQALQAYKTIEAQAATIVAFGAPEELKTFVDQFIEMAARTRAMAEDRGEPHFVEWFDELIAKAEALRTEIVQR